MVIVFNIIGYIALMSSLTSLVSLLIGDQIIKPLNLETKYPKLAKYIKFKQTVNKHSLMFNIFYTLLLILIFVIIFMFFFLNIFYNFYPTGQGLLPLFWF